MDELKRKLYGSNRLRLELSDFITPEQFCFQAREFSIKSGIPIRKGELEKRLFAGRAEMMSWLPGDMSGFFPGRIFWEAGSAYVDWIYMANRTFSDPFYEDTIRRQIVTPLNLLLGFTSRLESIWSFEGANAVPPAGFIFHVSRCGSTLVSHMLSAVDGHIVLSEPPPVDALLRSHFHDPDMDEDRKIRLIRQMVKIMGQQRQPWERHLFIKFDSWHLTILPLIRKAFPKIPILILSRDPVEVLVSHLKKPVNQYVPLCENIWGMSNIL